MTNTKNRLFQAICAEMIKGDLVVRVYNLKWRLLAESMMKEAFNWKVVDAQGTGAREGRPEEETKAGLAMKHKN